MSILWNILSVCVKAHNNRIFFKQFRVVTRKVLGIQNKETLKD